MDLTVAVHPRSGGQGGSGAWGGGAARRSSAPRRRAAGEGELGAAGLGLGPGLAVGHERGMRNPLQWKARCCGGRSRVCGVERRR